jgi:acyl carrier protein
MPTEPPSDQAAAVREKLLGYPEGTTEAVLAYLERGADADLDHAVAGILRFHTPPRPDGTKPDPTALTAETRLREDLGIDSLAFAEMGFLVEDLVGAPLPEEDPLALQTVADFRTHVRRALASK